MPFTLDAEIAPRSFTAGSWIIGSRYRHDRTLDHFGTQLDTTIVISGPVGKFPTGTDLHTVLLDLFSRVAALEDGVHYVATFSAGAFIQPYLTASAVIYKAIAGTSQTFKADAEIRRGGSLVVPFDAYLIKTAQTSFSMAAWLIDDVC